MGIAIPPPLVPIAGEGRSRRNRHQKWIQALSRRGWEVSSPSWSPSLSDVVDATLLRGRSPSPPLWERFDVRSRAWLAGSGGRGSGGAGGCAAGGCAAVAAAGGGRGSGGQRWVLAGVAAVGSGEAGGGSGGRWQRWAAAGSGGRGSGGRGSGRRGSGRRGSGWLGRLRCC